MKNKSQSVKSSNVSGVKNKSCLPYPPPIKPDYSVQKLPYNPFHGAQVLKLNTTINNY